MVNGSDNIMLCLLLQKQNDFALTKAEFENHLILSPSLFTLDQLIYKKNNEKRNSVIFKMIYQPYSSVILNFRIFCKI